MQGKLKAAGVPTKLVTLKGAPHPFWMSQPWLDETADAMGDWFQEFLK
jgi:pectinesterase